MKFSRTTLSHWKAIRFASWFDQAEIPKVEVPDEPVVRDITPRLQDMYMPRVEEEPKEDEQRWTVEPTAFDLWSVHGAVKPDQSSLFEQRDEAWDRDREMERKVKEDQNNRRSPLGDIFKFVSFKAKSPYYGDTCMNGFGTCQHGGKIMHGHDMIRAIPIDGQGPTYKFHRGGSCQENATNWLHEMIQRTI